MSTTLPLTQFVQIAAPCDASWDDMPGDERRRFCEQCGLHVYNLSAMTTEAARDLIESTTGRLCGRVFRRADGTILSRDCPVGVRALRKRAMKMCRRAVACIALALMTTFAAFAGAASLQDLLRSGSGGALAVDVDPGRRIRRWLNPAPPPPTPGFGGWEMGEIAVVVPPNTPSQCGGTGAGAG